MHHHVQGRIIGPFWIQKAILITAMQDEVIVDQFALFKPQKLNRYELIGEAGLAELCFTQHLTFWRSDDPVDCLGT